MEQGKSLNGVLTLDNATSAQREALDRLLGRSPTKGASLSLRLIDLESLLQRAEICTTLSDAMNAIFGPVSNLRAMRDEISSQWRQLFDEERHTNSNDAQRLNWLNKLETTGLLRRLSRNDIDIAAKLLRDAIRVLNGLPCQGVPLAEFAARVLGDSHALDSTQPVATLVLRSISDEGNTEKPSFESRRDAWASVGIMLDELSCPALVLNLNAEPDSLTGQLLNLHAAKGEPCRLTVRQLLRHRPRFDPGVLGEVVYICENPTVVAAAANRLGSRCAPLVCTEGQPKTAIRLLLNQFAAADIALLYHGDFDWSGIQIANFVMERHGAAPWRFDTESYRRFCGAKRLIGRPISASWDGDLMPTMTSVGRALDEEQMLDELLIDLAS